MTSKRMVVFWVRTNCCQQRIAVDILVPLPTSLLDLEIVAANVVSAGVGDVQPPNVIQCCEPSPFEGSDHCRWRRAGTGHASAQAFKPPRFPLNPFGPWSRCFDMLGGSPKDAAAPRCN